MKADRNLYQEIWDAGRFEEYAQGLRKRAEEYAHAADILTDAGELFLAEACKAKVRSLHETANWRPACQTT